MEKLIGIIILCTCLVSPCFGVELEEIEKWDWQCPLKSQTDNQGFMKIKVTSEIFDRSKNNLNDLRILDGDNEFVPHYVKWETTKSREILNWKTSSLINKTFRPEEFSRVTLDFGETLDKNEIKIHLSGNNFRREALLEGSLDGEDWSIVAENNWLFDVSLPNENLKVDTIEFPKNNFRYLRLTVYNMEDDPRKIEILGAQTATRKKIERKLIPAPAKIIAVTDEKKTRQTIYELDTGFKNLPLTTLKINTSEPFFNRGVEIWGRNSATEIIKRKTETHWDETTRDIPRRRVSSGIFYRIIKEGKTSESLEIENFNAPYRFIQIRVSEGNNPSLRIEQFHLFQKEAQVVFQYQPQKIYRLIGGNIVARKPNYDLAQSYKEIDKWELPDIFPGPFEPIAKKEKGLPWSEKKSGIIWIVLIIAVGGMLYLVVKNLGTLKEN